jgi:regulatory protein
MLIGLAQPWRIHGCLHFMDMARKITGLIAQKRNKDRVSVYLDGEFAFGLAAIEAIKLHKGQILGDEDIERLRALDEIERTHERALNLLSYRPRSTEEVRRRLQSAGFSEHAVETTLERLSRSALLDDLAFARYWVDNREQFKPRGARALRQELRQKGVPDAFITEALDKLDEEELAYRVGRERFQRLRNLDEATCRKRLGDFLLRRGFSYEIVRDVMDRLWNEFGQDWDGHGNSEG